MKFNTNESRSKKFCSMSTIVEEGGFAFLKLMKVGVGVIGEAPVDKEALALLADAYGGKYIEVNPYSPTPSSGIPLEINGINYGKGSFWMYYEYEDENYPLLFVELPHLNNRDIVCLLRLFDKLYGDTNQETTEWTLEYQLLTRMLVTEKQLLVNPKYLDLSDTEGIDVLNAIPVEDRSRYLSARNITPEQVQRMHGASIGDTTNLERGLNTRISYLYRDASNYKVFNEAIVKGVLTEEQQAFILSCLYDGEYFIPSQVGLPGERFGSETEDDHCWFELSEGFAKTTQQKPTVEITTQELIAAFLAAKDNWEEV